MSETGGLSQIAVLIPAREPDAGMVELVQQLAAAGFGAVIVLDDGSSSACTETFASTAQIPGVHSLQHKVNLGKGRALKTGIQYFLDTLPEFTGLVTADADGQHTVADIIRVAHSLQAANGRAIPNAFAILGTRRFTQSVPLRSRFGNAVTRKMFRLAARMKLSDTQTGLRAFPRAMLPELILLPGERYEYEMAVLAYICSEGKRPLEVPIQTVYKDGNKSSHFHPVRDSLRIYFVLLRFLVSPSWYRALISPASAPPSHSRTIL